MGQKRTQNIIDNKIGNHLAEFQKKLIERIEDSYISRIDELKRSENILTGHLNELENILERNQRFVDNAEFKMTMRYMVAGALGGGIGAMVVVLCLVWIGVL